MTVYDVCEIETHESGTTEMTLTQILDVTDIWDYEEVNELLAEQENKGSPAKKRG